MKTSAQTFRHLGEYRIVALSPKGPWTVVESATGNRVGGPYKVFRNAWQKRKALIAGVDVRTARGLPS